MLPWDGSVSPPCSFLIFNSRETEYVEEKKDFSHVLHQSLRINDSAGSSNLSYSQQTLLAQHKHTYKDLFLYVFPSVHLTYFPLAAVSKRPRWKTAMGINKAFFCQVSGWYSGYLLWGVDRGLWQWLVAGGLPMLLIHNAFLTPSLCEHLNSYPIASALSHRFKYNRFYIFIDKRLSFLWVPECIWGYLVAKFWAKCIALIKGHS